MPSEAQIDAWEVEFPNANIGLPAGPANGLGFFDCDSFTPALAQTMRDMIGHSQVTRVGQKGFVIPVKFDGQRTNKLKYRGLPLAEFLGDGRQVAAIGVHPDTGQPYTWNGGSPLELTRNEMIEVAVKLPDVHMQLMEVELAKMHFELDPRDREKEKDERGLVGVGGRNDALKSQTGAMFAKGKSQAQAVAELMAFDKAHHRLPLFEDATENLVGSNPLDRATSFVSNIYHSLTQDRLRSGVALPEPVPERVELDNEAVRDAAARASAINYQRNKHGELVNNEFNVGIALRTSDDHRKRFWFDEFYQRIMVATPKGLREWQDIDDLDLLVALQTNLGWSNLTLSTVRSAVEVHAYANTKNMPRDWLDGLVWDKSPRIEHFFTEAFGSDETEYIKAVSSNFWVAMVARVYRPGCKFDNMVVLEGHQGARKSSALEVIGGHWFAASGDDLGSKDFLQNLGGKLLIELPELDSFGKSGIRTIKRILSNRVDTYRASYGRRSKDYKRQCVFVGTTNEDEYLEDPTGGRRFWPVPVRAVDLDLVREVRSQCFAEAVAALKGGATWWEVPASAEAVQTGRRRHDAWEEPIEDYLAGRSTAEDIRIIDIATEALKIEKGRLNPNDQKRIGGILRAMNYTKFTSKAEGGKKQKHWRKPEMS
jgi:putative DNA primase/helicase